MDARVKIYGQVQRCNPKREVGGMKKNAYTLRESKSKL